MPTAKYLARRAVTVEASIRTRMLHLAAKLEDVIALGRGDPDFDTPAAIVQAGVRALEQGFHHYTIPAGLAELRTAISDKLLREKGLEYSPKQVIVCNGCQEAAFIAILALVDPGDEVILQAPRFDAFDYMVNIAGGRVVTVPTKEEEDFALKAEDLRRAITDKTKLLLVANPNNPTGALIGRDELEKIAELAVQNDLLVISDEIYDKIIFDNREHYSLASFPDMYERTVTINGFSKAYAMTGWRVGYLAAPMWLIEPAIEIKHSISICTPPAMQCGALEAIRHGETALAEMVATYQRRRDLIMKGLDQLGMTYGHPGGGMYVYVNVSSSGLDAERFCYDLLEQEKVMIFPGTMFADKRNQHVRISLLAPEKKIQEALHRIGRFLKREPVAQG
jgi:aminotransferase